MSDLVIEVFDQNLDPQQDGAQVDGAFFIQKNG